jgi:hypothetical protein
MTDRPQKPKGVQLLFSQVQEQAIGTHINAAQKMLDMSMLT